MMETMPFSPLLLGMLCRVGTRIFTLLALLILLVTPLLLVWLSLANIRFSNNYIARKEIDLPAPFI